MKKEEKKKAHKHNPKTPPESAPPRAR
eukprot:SAG25_NODE_2060_length_1993_cov_1.576030_4_plen_26_part_01